MFSPDLSRLIHASTILGGKGFSSSVKDIAISPLGPVVFGNVSPKDPYHELLSSNTDKTNYLAEKLLGKKDMMFGLYPSLNWFLY